ncbi:hypothetical protein T07_9162 [Trichinella nelsoni]|uniref:Uncharacterized protein n=1 Tax=Trichinella nelsoni TaxID=6336 RepID=A0A0V0RW86_9BILA|nr:hypothetical protein T07_9162 [Trichinella nelsoni]
MKLSEKRDLHFSAGGMWTKNIVFKNLFIFILLALLNRLGRLSANNIDMLQNLVTVNLSIVPVIKNLVVPALHQKKLPFTALTGIHAEMMPLSFEQPRNQVR